MEQMRAFQLQLTIDQRIHTFLAMRHKERWDVPVIRTFFKGQVANS